MFHSFKYLSIVFFISGLLLLLIDSKIYKVGGFVREKKASSIMGWIHLGLCLVSALCLSLFSQ